MLTEKQKHVLDIIAEFIAKYGKSPTIEELKNLLNQKSKRGVVQYLETLEKKWFITRWAWFRWIKLGNSIWFQTTLNIPILGYANAGKPLAEATQNDYWIIPVSKSMIKWNKDKYFILKVEWTSMNDFEINWKTIDNKSYVLVKKDETNINEKDAFLFIINNSATIKVVKKDWNTLYLLPKSKNDYHKPMIFSNKDNIIINGKIVDVFNFN